MPVTKKSFLKGINSDDASYLMDPKEYLGALNIRFITSENGQVGQITNIEGNQLKNQTIGHTGVTTTFTLPQYGYNRTIGAYEDHAKRRLFWFNYNSTGWHGIYCYDADTDKIYTLLEQPNNGSILGFKEDRFIHSVAMAENQLFWTDGDQKRINVEAAIKAQHPSYTTSVKRYEIYNTIVLTAGSGYTNGVYVDVPVSAVASPDPSWIGVGGRATVTVAGGVVTKVVMTNFGRYYRNGDEFTVSSALIGGTGSGLVIKISAMLDASVLSLIRYKPMFPLTATAVNQTSPVLVNNLVDNDSFQFTYRYVYRDGEVSVFAPLSNMVAYYHPSYNIYNSIDIAHPNQLIQQDVVRVEFAVKYMTGGKMFIIKTFNEANIAVHNTGSWLSYRFYNDTVGASVSDAETAKAFDYVPITSQTLEIAKNRLFLGNNVYGYDNPSTSSISASALPITINSTNGLWMKLEFLKTGVVYTKYYIGIASPTVGYNYYYPDTQPTPPSFPATLDFVTDLNAFPGGATTGEAIASYEGGTLISFTYTGFKASITSAGAGATAGGTIFKSNAFYKVGVVFYDKAGRKSGVITSDSAKAVTADISYTNATYSREIMWNLSNTDALTQIPEWAWYYSIVRTKCLSVSSFMQWRGGMVYIKKDPTTGNYTTATAYTADVFGIGIDESNMVTFGMGYTYREDDTVRLYRSTGGNPYLLNVKGKFGQYIIVDPVDFGTSTGLLNLYELSSPYINIADEFYYEVGPMLRVSNPTTNFRTYETTYGFLKGDVYVKERTVPTSYYTENMSLNDVYWQNWYTGIGMANAITNSGRSIMPVTVSYSNNYMPGTLVNGLSTFDALDTVDLPVELESIQKLIITSKVQFEGNVMLAIGEEETANIYIGETQVFDNTGSSFLAKSSGVVGNISVLRGSFGTINPESAFEWGGEVLFFDANRGSWVRYNVNGLFAISENKMRKFFKKVGDDIFNYRKNPSVYNAINPNFPLRVLGMVDPYHEEYLMSMPRMSVVPRNAVLDDVELDTYSYSFTLVAAILGGTPNSLSGFTYLFGSGPSTEQSFTLSGSGLTPNGTVLITAPTGYEVGTTPSLFFPSITVSYTGTGVFAQNTIYVRLKSGLGVGSATGNITLVGGGASSTVALSGSVSAPAGATLTATPSSTTILNYIELNGPSTAVQIQLNGFNLSPASGNITIPSSTNIEVSKVSATSGFSTSGTTIAYTGGALPSTNIWIRLKAGLAAGPYSESITITGGGGTATITGSGTVTDWEVITLVPAGLGTSVAQACSTQGSYTLVTPYTGSPFGSGTVLFYSSMGMPTTVVTGYTFVHAYGSVWNLDSATGTVLSLSTTQC
jgi:hypothetical protein